MEPFLYSNTNPLNRQGKNKNFTCIFLEHSQSLTKGRKYMQAISGEEEGRFLTVRGINALHNRGKRIIINEY